MNTGTFASSTITFGSLSSITSYGSTDGFLLKLSTSGTEQWAIGYGGTSSESSYGITVDNTTSVVYLTGGFYSSTATFGSTTLTNAGSGNIWVAKVTSSGSVTWAKSFVWLKC